MLTGTLPIFAIGVIIGSIILFFVRKIRNAKNEMAANSLAAKISQLNSDGSILDGHPIIADLLSQMDTIYSKKSFSELSKLELNFPNNEIYLKTNQITFTIKEVVSINDFTAIIIVSCKKEGFSDSGDDKDIYSFKFKILLVKETSAVEIYSDLYEDNITKSIRKQFATIIFESITEGLSRKI